MLGRIRDAYDPQGLFIVAEGVGSEKWDSSLNCRVDQDDVAAYGDLAQTPVSVRRYDIPTHQEL
jgi:hypothetical protein